MKEVGEGRIHQGMAQRKWEWNWVLQDLDGEERKKERLYKAGKGVNEVGSGDRDSAETQDGKQTGSSLGNGKTRQWEVLCGKDLSKTRSLDLAQLHHCSYH